MKTLSFFLIGIALWAQPSTAQINININLGAQPQWGPSGYNYVDYYYLPDIETYYYVPQRQFIYLNNGQWAFSNYLPSRYSGYNLYSGYKVVLNSPRPYRYFSDHKVKYAKFKGVKGRQATLRGKSHTAAKKSSYSNTGNGPKYSPGNSGNKRVIKYNNSNGNGKGNGNGNGKGNGKGRGKH